MKVTNLIKTIAFVICFCILAAICGRFLLPVRTAWNHYHTMNDFYLEPENTIEVVFLGSSVVANGINPMQLYQKQGICSYNLGTENQPFPASYYWLEEVHRLHSDTLSTVVIDASVLRYTPGVGMFRVALDRLQPSSVKREAVSAYSDDFETFVSYYWPLLSYHDRWAESDRGDWEEDILQDGTRGYHFQTGINRQGIQIQSEFLDITLFEKANFENVSLMYFEKMVDFCKGHDLNLILLKTPQLTWSRTQYELAKQLTDSYGIEYIDFNFDKEYQLTDLSYVLDMIDMRHLNYFGASKLTDVVGKYLAEKGYVHDVRDESEYSFMEEEAERYAYTTERKLNLAQEEDFLTYLETALSYEECEVLLSVRDEASTALSKADRKKLDDLGFELLSELDYRGGYLGIAEDGEVVSEDVQNVPEMKNGKESVSDIVPLSQEIDFPDKEKCSIVSAGFYAGSMSSIKIGETEYSPNGRGVNIVVYDYKNHEVLGAAAFDTYTSTTREVLTFADYQMAKEQGLTWRDVEGDMQALYHYDRKVENARKNTIWRNNADDSFLIPYLDFWMEDPDYMILLSCRDEAAGALEPDVRLVFADRGMLDLAELEYRDSYIGVINEGQVEYEAKDHGETPIEYHGAGVDIISGGFESGNVSSICVNGTEYSPNTRGMNVVVYDKELRKVVSKYTFDSCETRQNAADFRTVFQYRETDSDLNISAFSEEDAA